MEVVEQPDRVKSQLVCPSRDGDTPRPRFGGVPPGVLAGPSLGNYHSKFHGRMIRSHFVRGRVSQRVRGVGCIASAAAFCAIETRRP
jgi:hypothetical protein